MELRITNFLAPLSRSAAFFLSELNVNPTSVSLASFAAALLAALIYAVSFQLPFISSRTAVLIVSILILLNAFLDDVERRVETRSRKKSIFGGPLGNLLGQLSDIIILFGALVFLAARDTYYNFGKLGLLDLRYVEPGPDGHTAMGIALFTGVLILKNHAAKNKEKTPGLWTRSERMYVFTAFNVLGLYTGMFSGFLFTGILILLAAIYLSLLHRSPIIGKRLVSEKKAYRAQMGVRRSLRAVTRIVSSIVKTVLRIVGVTLLGIYLLVERIYVRIERSLGSASHRLRNLKAPAILKGDNAPISHPLIEAGGVTYEEDAETEEAVEEETVTLDVETDERAVASSEPEPMNIDFPPAVEPEVSYASAEGGGESLFVEYEPTSKKEDAVMDMVDFMIGEGRDIVIAASQPATALYRDKYSGVAGIRVINLPERSTAVGDEEIPMTNLEYFGEVFEELSKSHVFILEPLSSLILHVGVSQAYKFVSQTLDRLSGSGATFIVFMNIKGHDKMDIANFENLFMNIATVEHGKLKKVK